MTVTEFRGVVKNLYAAVAQLEAGTQIPAGEGVQIARIVVTKMLEKDGIDIPKV